MSATGSTHHHRTSTNMFCCSYSLCVCVLIGASLSEPHLGPYSGCGLCHMVIYRTSCPMRMRAVYVGSIFKFKGQSRPSQQDREEARLSRTGGTLEVSLRF